MRNIVLFLFIGLGSLFANNGHVESDIVPRAVNFLIFAGVMYYLLSTKIKDSFSEKQNNISSALSSVDEKIKLSKKELEEAKKSVEDAKSVAKSIKDSTQAEVDVVLDKMQKQGEFDIELLDRQKEELKEVARNHMIRDVITESLDEIINVDNVVENKEELIKSLLKKVA